MFCLTLIALLFLHKGKYTLLVFDFEDKSKELLVDAYEDAVKD